MGTSLINRKAVKELLLAQAKQRYRDFPECYRPTRVSASTLDAIEAEVRRAVRHTIENRPSKGKTI